ncbi:glycosyltransferase, partial [Desulfomicrobium salsuginis]
MKVLHIVAGELSGGAARGAYWLHCGLREIGIESKILTNSRTTLGDNGVVSVTKSKKDKAFNFFRSHFDHMLAAFYAKREKFIFSSGIIGYDFTKNREYEEADIVHLHWINAGFIDMQHLKKVNKPMVWTMRDMWPMTGGCHYAMGCENYKIGCGNCKQLRSESGLDLSRFILWRKKKFLPKSIKIVGISNWLTEQAKASDLFKSYDIRTIHNNVSSNALYPIDKIIAKSILGIKTDKKVILAGATDLNSFYKGFSKYIEALKYLDKNQYYLCFFGRVDNSVVQSLGFEYTSFGFMYDNVSLMLIYSSADVFVAPSLMEAFGKTLAESMACGT